MAKKTSTTHDKGVLLDLYHRMQSIRSCEEQLVKLYAAGNIYGGVHTYIGQEAVATGVGAHLRQEDLVFSTHRGHGHALAKGVTPRELIAELLGRSTGCSGGRGGSMHLFKPEIGFMGSSGIVGPSILLAAGTAYTAKLMKIDRIGVAFFGDGATNNGAFHEGLNLASIWDLPVVFVCENNMYATEVPYATVTKNVNAAERASVYGLHCEVLDGNDVVAIYDAAGKAVERARAGRGPSFLECKTYRTRAHSEGMRDAGYRTPDEVDQWKKRDPISVLKERLIADGTATEEEVAAIDAEVKAATEDARRFALESPLPEASSVMDFVYSEA